MGSKSQLKKARTYREWLWREVRTARAQKRKWNKKVDKFLEDKGYLNIDYLAELKSWTETEQALSRSYDKYLEFLEEK